VFFDVKADEIVHIFKPAFTDEWQRIFNIVSEVNPANSSKYSFDSGKNELIVNKKR